MKKVPLGKYVVIKTGKLDANAANLGGAYPFFTCAVETLRIDTYSYDCECVLIAGNGDLNAKYYQGKFDAYQRTYIIESKDKSVLCVKYLYHFMNQYVARLREMSIGGVIKYIKLGYLTDASVPLPPLPEQRRIAAILDKADALRAKRREGIAKLDQLLQSVFLDMFGDPVTNPKVWDVKPIEAIGEVITGNTPPRSRPEYYGKTIEWIKSDNINTPHHYLTQAEERLSEEGKAVARIAPIGAILVTCIAGTPACIGNVAMANRKTAFNQQINALVPAVGHETLFLYSQILFRKELIRQASTNSMKGMVSKGKFQKIKLICPPAELQKTFCGIFQKCQAIRENFEASFDETKTLFDALTVELFAGGKQQVGEIIKNQVGEIDHALQL